MGDIAVSVVDGGFQFWSSVDRSAQGERAGDISRARSFPAQYNQLLQLVIKHAAFLRLLIRLVQSQRRPYVLVHFCRNVLSKDEPGEETECLELGYAVDEHLYGRGTKRQRMAIPDDEI